MNPTPRICSFKDVLHGLATKLGLDPQTQLQDSQARALTVHINEAYEFCWDAFPWPEAMVIEARTATAGLLPWSESAKETLGMVKSVWSAHPLLCSASASKVNFAVGPAGIYLCDCASVLPTTLGSKAVEVLTYENGGSGGTATITFKNSTVPSVTQTGTDAEDLLEKLRDALLASTAFTALYTVAYDSIGLTLTFTAVANGADQIINTFTTNLFSIGRTAGVNDTQTAYVVFRPQAPTFTSTVWEATKSYVAEERIYFPTDGHCYRCLVADEGTIPGTDATVWERVPVLRELQQMVIYGALASARDDEGQSQTALLARTQRDDQLFLKINILSNQSGQTLRAKLVA